jgi:hypothetical protein
VSQDERSAETRLDQALEAIGDLVEVLGLHPGDLFDDCAITQALITEKNLHGEKAFDWLPLPLREDLLDVLGQVERHMGLVEGDSSDELACEEQADRERQAAIERAAEGHYRAQEGDDSHA